MLRLYILILFLTQYCHGTTNSSKILEIMLKENHDLLLSQHYNLKLLTKILKEQGSALAAAGKALQGMAHTKLPEDTHTAPAAAHGHQRWSYDGHYGPGPKNWDELSTECHGPYQSPINLDTKLANSTGPVTPFVLRGYDIPPNKAKITNNGHSIKMSVDMGDNPIPSVSGGGLPEGEYQLAQLHFHWGQNLEVGSEHTWDGLRFPLEMHLVHFKKEYGGIAESLKHKDGLAVLGVWFEVSVFRKPPRWMHTIAKAVKHTLEADEYWMVPPNRLAPLRELLPDNIERFYRYRGSLTTPPCTQVVIWTVFRETLSIRAHDLSTFRKVKDFDGHYLVDNFRPLQSLRRRKVLKVGME